MYILRKKTWKLKTISFFALKIETTLAEGVVNHISEARNANEVRLNPRLGLLRSITVVLIILNKC